MADPDSITYTLYRRPPSPNWHINIRLPDGRRIRTSSKTGVKEWAEEIACKMVDGLRPKEGIELIREWIANGDPYVSSRQYLDYCSELSVETQGTPFDVIHPSSETLPARCYRDHGVVYVLQNQDGSTKIGISIKPRLRIKSIENTMGARLKRIYLSQECLNYEAIEQDMHREFSARRTRHGEWFKAEFLVVVAMLKQQEFVSVDEEERMERWRACFERIENRPART